MVREHLDLGGSSEDLTEELRLTTLALNAAIDSIIVHRVDGTVVRFNDAAAARAGLTREEFAKLPPWGWTSYADPEVRQARTDEICRQGMMSFRAPSLDPEGRTVWMEIHARCIEFEGETLIVSVARDVTEQVRVTRVLEDLAFHDPLTGLANRAAFDDALTAAITGVRRHDDRVGIAYLDLDDFKCINDTLGHEAGDQVLIALARRLRSCVRAADTVARLGGDEFVLVLPRLETGEALDEMAERLIAVVEQPMTVEDHEVALNASLGLALFEPEHDDARSVVVKADLAMYSAKHSGDRKWLVYAENMTPNPTPAHG